MRKLMSGNEAIAYGAYLSGVRVAAAYPGTPSTEILENLVRYPGVYAEWSPNEKVAADVAIGAAYAGVRALAAMKHVGVNVAADSLFYASYTGMEAGLVVVSADDPGMYSSQNEQDNRYYGKFAKVPILEPSDSEEAKRFVRLAFAISEAFDTPVLLRTTTRISHSKTPVEIEEKGGPPGAVEEGRGAGTETRGFSRNPAKYVMIPGYARLRHPVVEERLRRLSEFTETFPENRIEEGDPALGIVACGVAYQYAREVFPGATFLKLGMSYPLPKRLVRDFASRIGKLVVIEELDPFLEEELRLMGLEVAGKGIFPVAGEFNPQVVREGAVRAGLIPPAPPEEPGPAVHLPRRPPVLCPGCAHRGVFYALQRLKAVVFGDIGCYTLGVMPPLSAMDTCGCMGASIGVLHGADKAGLPGPRVAVIGDSTFFHTGITPLINVIYNQGAGTVIIMDNRITAMTGHQDHPGTGKTLGGTDTVTVDLETLVRGLGVEFVRTVDPYDFRLVQKVIKQAMAAAGPAVVIARYPCVLHTREKHPVPVVDEERCTNCKVCLRLGCPPLVQAGEVVHIDELLCNGCGLCVRVCPFKAIAVPGQQAETAG